MRRRVIVGLLALNGVAGAALLSSPARSQTVPLGIFDCCKEDIIESKGWYCCKRCCWFTYNCDDYWDCDPKE